MLYFVELEECKVMTLEEERVFLEQERNSLEEQRRQLEREKQEFERRMAFENKKLEQQQQLFDMKVKILEEELVKLAADKKKVEQQREFYYRVKDFQEEDMANNGSDNSNVIKGDIFFAGVGNRISLRKRYRNLIKIYHPDNIDGDNNTIQEINREYDRLSKSFGL